MPTPSMPISTNRFAGAVLIPATLLAPLGGEYSTARRPAPRGAGGGSATGRRGPGSGARAGRDGAPAAGGGTGDERGGDHERQPAPRPRRRRTATRPPWARLGRPPGEPFIHTPNLDRLAAESAVFDRFYVSSLPHHPLPHGPLHRPLLLPPPALAARSSRGTWCSPKLVRRGRVPAGAVLRHAAAGQRRRQLHPRLRRLAVDPGAARRPLERRSRRAARCRRRRTSSRARPRRKLYLRNTAGRVYERDWMCARTLTAAMDWLERNRRRGRPGGPPGFVMYVDMWDPHEPFDAPDFDVERYADPAYAGDQVIYPQYGRPDYLTPEEHNHVRALYAGLVTTADRWLGHLLDKLDVRRPGRAHPGRAPHRPRPSLRRAPPAGQAGRPAGQPLPADDPHPADAPPPPGRSAPGRRVAGLAQHVDLLPTMLEFLGRRSAGGRRGALAVAPGARASGPRLREHAFSGRFPNELAAALGDRAQPGGAGGGLRRRRRGGHRPGAPGGGADRHHRGLGPGAQPQRPALRAVRPDGRPRPGAQRDRRAPGRRPRAARRPDPLPRRRGDGRRRGSRRSGATPWPAPPRREPAALAADTAAVRLRGRRAACPSPSPTRRRPGPTPPAPACARPPSAPCGTSTPGRCCTPRRSTTGWRTWGERRRRRRRAAPHLVVIMTDQQKATAIDLYGGPVRTAGLARLAPPGTALRAGLHAAPAVRPGAGLVLDRALAAQPRGAHERDSPCPAGRPTSPASCATPATAWATSARTTASPPQDFDRLLRPRLPRRPRRPLRPGRDHVRSGARAAGRGRAPDPGTVAPPGGPGARRAARGLGHLPRRRRGHAASWRRTPAGTAAAGPVGLHPRPPRAVQVPPALRLALPAGVGRPCRPGGRASWTTKPERQRVFSDLLHYDDLTRGRRAPGGEHLLRHDRLRRRAGRASCWTPWSASGCARTRSSSSPATTATTWASTTCWASPTPSTTA